MPILKSLHWLLVSFCFCIDFKILLAVIKALHGLAPADLADMFVMYEPGWASGPLSLLVVLK